MFCLYVINSQQICDIIDTNQLRRETLNNVVDTRSRRAVTFKDIAQLTFGINYILNQQVTTLLGKYNSVVKQLSIAIATVFV